MLSKNEFAIVNALRTNAEVGSQAELATITGLSVGTVNSTLRTLRKNGLATNERPFSLTEEGLASLEPYRVKNAVIMAAGLSSNFAPISYEKPKGLLRVRGEILIERQIEQLIEAGIKDITVVVGYLKEQFFYLAEKYGVKLVVNEEYATRGNHSTLYLVRDILDNTYICSSDNYFTENVFEPFVYEAYYAGIFTEGHTDEYCFHVKSRDVIDRISLDGENCWSMLGHAYFDRAFSKQFGPMLEEAMALPATRVNLWEDVLRENIRSLRMVLRRYEPGIIYEFDTLDDVSEFDPEFINLVDSSIMDNICKVLGCARSDISQIEPITQGLTNISFSFRVGPQRYVYRHPGPATDGIISRDSETYSEKIAHELDLDDTFIYEDEAEGWKISRFIENCVPFDYHNPEHVREGIALGRKLHQAKRQSQWSFDVYAKAEEICEMLSARSRDQFTDFKEMQERAKQLNDFVKSDNVEQVLCHNDFYDPNFLVGEDRIRLIDWEYSGMSDYASDLGTFICCSDYTFEEANEVLEIYFERKPTPEELRHCYAYVGLSSWYWFVWAILQEAQDNPVGEYLLLWYQYANLFGKKAVELYQA